MAMARKKILCIEDDRESAALIAEELVDQGFAVQVEYDGHKGFVAILKDRPDLVLCDVNTPNLSGFEVRESLSEFGPSFGRVPFVFLTVPADSSNALKERQVGTDAYVTKPIDFDVLVTTINARLIGITCTKPLHKLSDREIETLAWVARGKTSAEIAPRLGLVKRTVDFHLDNARIKLSAATRAEAVMKAVAAGLIEPQ
jgi:DNA-binding NarL/FixJ family response regulator